ncbi:MAG: hypothetical protein EZS28_049616, partial [Streblomastix strix]
MGQLECQRIGTLKKCQLQIGWIDSQHFLKINFQGFHFLVSGILDQYIHSEACQASISSLSRLSPQ